MKHKQHDVLCLNRSWVPVHVIEWQRAISLIYQEKARSLDKSFTIYTYEDWLKFSVLQPDDYFKVHSISYTLMIPEIIVSISFNRLPDRQVKYSRQNVFSRDKYICAYCNSKFLVKKLTVDHIIPKDYGGKTTWDNVITSCFNCNQEKRNRTPKEAGMHLHFKPHKPDWFSPLSSVNLALHPCKSWKHFMNRVDITQEDESITHT